MEEGGTLYFTKFSEIPYGIKKKVAQLKGSPPLIHRCIIGFLVDNTFRNKDCFDFEDSNVLWGPLVSTRFGSLKLTIQFLPILK